MQLDEPKRVTQPAVIDRIKQLRVHVWRAAGQLAPGAPDSVGEDEHDGHAHHVAVLCDRQPVAAARFCLHDRLDDVADAELYPGIEGETPAPIASYNRMVVDPAWQGQRLSTAIDRLIVLAALKLGARSIVGTCAARRARSVEPLGFRPAGVELGSPRGRLLSEPGTIVRLLAPRCQAVTDPALLEDIYRLRVDVWRAAGEDVPGASTDGRWRDAHDAHARHVAFVEDGRPIAAGRFCVHRSLAEVPDAETYASLRAELAAPVASLNRLVVHPSAQGRGLSTDLDLWRIVAAASAGCRTVIACAGKGRDRSLLRRGFRPLGAADHFLGEGLLLWMPLPAAVSTF